MTDVYELDGRALSEKEAAHRYLKEQLGFPDYYGMNLDALYDLLTERTGETLLWVSHADAVHPAIAGVLEDAMEENPRLTVLYESNDEDGDEAYREGAE